MASLWSVGSVDIYVNDDKSEASVNLAKIEVLDATGSSVLHYFGTGTEERSVSGWMFGESDKGTLEGYRDNGTTVTLTSDQGNEGSFIVKDASFSRYGPVVRVSVPGVSTSATVYKVKVDLLKT